jgi:hypothetical protein
MEISDKEKEVKMLQLQDACRDLKMEHSSTLETLKTSESERVILQDALNSRDETIELLNKQLVEERTNTQSRVEVLTRKEAAFERRDAELRASVSKLINVEKNIEAELTCLHCMNVFEKPVTVSTCGHNYCFKCTPGYTPACSECTDMGRVKEGEEGSILPDDRLGTLVGKFLYIKQTLSSMKEGLEVLI